jgi:hypothetical protein
MCTATSPAIDETVSHNLEEAFKCPLDVFRSEIENDKMREDEVVARARKWLDELNSLPRKPNRKARMNRSIGHSCTAASGLDGCIHGSIYLCNTSCLVAKIPSLIPTIDFLSQRKTILARLQPSRP